MFPLVLSRRPVRGTVSRQGIHRTIRSTFRRHAFEPLEDRALLSLASLLAQLDLEGGVPVAAPSRIQIEALSLGTTSPAAQRQPGPDAFDLLLDFVAAPRGDKPPGYARYELKNVLVSSFATLGDSQPQESLSLNFSTMHIPRIGHEVVVDSLEGDPDQPIVLRSLNSASDPQGTNLLAGATARLLNNDTGSAVQMYLHSEKDQTIGVENDETHWVCPDFTVGVLSLDTLTVDPNRTETVDNNETITVHTNRSESVGQNETITISGAVGTNESVTVGAAQTVSNGAAATQVAGVAARGLGGDALRFFAGQSSFTWLADGTVRILSPDPNSPSGPVDASAPPAVVLAHLLPYLEQDGLYKSHNGGSLPPQVGFSVDGLDGHATVDWAHAAAHMADAVAESVTSTPAGETCDDANYGYLQIELENTMISSYSIRPAAVAPAQQFALDYGIGPGLAQPGQPTQPWNSDIWVRTGVHHGQDGPLFCVQYRETDFNFLRLAAPLAGRDPQAIHLQVLRLEHDPPNQPPVVSAGADATIREGQWFTQAGAYGAYDDGDGIYGPWTATVDYGDGSGEHPLQLSAAMRARRLSCACSMPTLGTSALRSCRTKCGSAAECASLPAT